MNPTAALTATMSSEEKRALLAELLRARATRHSRDESAHGLFEAQAARTPTAVALGCDGRRLSYRELDGRANRLAHHLRALGVRPGVLVGLCLERSPAMVVALLAVLKAGGAYVPIDPTFPESRISLMLDDAHVAVLLTEQSLLESLPLGEARAVCVDSEWEGIDERPETAPGVRVNAADLAYVIYTSGSTGRPKGVQVTHGGLATFLRALRQPLGIAPVDTLLAVTTLSFDIAALELLLPLTVGARVELVTRAVASDGAKLAARLADPSITFLQATPATWRMLLEAGWAGSPGLTMLCGGEALPRPLADRLHPMGKALWNLYGPTETTIWSSLARVEPGEGPVAIGRPIAGTQMYVLDARLRLVPVGVTGELYIGGEGVTRGYLGRPSLTAERFLPDPFGKTPGARIYRTGDLARWQPDGTLECLGRSDHQVKVRGFRVEPGEIEAALAGHPAVRDAAVAARPDGTGEHALVAYLVFRDSAEPEPTAAALRGWLLKGLPEYMVPSTFVTLPALPLTPNGKVDRNALPEPDGDLLKASSVPYEAPRTTIEATIAEVWANVLRVDRVGVHDQFFELGGHSLLATQAVSWLHERLGVEVPLRTLFEAPTVAELAARLGPVARAASGDAIDRIVRRPHDGVVPLSFAQQALWYIDQLAPGEPTFNIAAAVRIDGPLDTGILARAFGETLRRHEALRTRFVAVGGQPEARVETVETVPLTHVDLSHLEPTARLAEARRLAEAEARRPFDLQQWPLARATLYTLDPNDHALSLVMHHIVVDGWSFAVASAELSALYDAYLTGRPSPLPELPVQYGDYAAWQRERFAGPARDQLLSFWTARLRDVPALELPTDRPRPPVRSARGAMLPFTLSAELSESVRTLGRDAGATPFMTLLAAFQALLGRYSGQDDFAVGTPVANRGRTEVEGLIGYFVNMLALRAELAGDPTFAELLARVRDAAIEALEHQELPLDVLVEAIRPPRDPSRTPLFQVMFVLQNNLMPEAMPTGLRLSPLDAAEGTGTAKFDLTLALTETPDGLFHGTLEYATDLFDEPTAARMLVHFHTLLSDAVAHPGQPVSRLALLDAAERRQVLEEWSGARVSAESPAGGFRAVHERFAEQARRTPGAEAVVAGGERLSYGVLNERAGRVAHHLRALGVGPGSLVGVRVGRTAGLWACVLGVLESGAAYLPLDPSWPDGRLGQVLSDARPAVVLSEGPLPGAASAHGTVVVELGADGCSFADRAGGDLGVRVNRSDLAYVIYTSGTTGVPKGVMVSHGAIAASCAAWESEYGLGTWGGRHLQMAAVAFDVFTGDWVRALCTGGGGALVSCPRELLFEPEGLYGLMVRERVDCAEFVPASLEGLVSWCERAGRDLRFMRLLAVGSDRLHPGLYERARRLCGPGGRVVNSYGLTEAAVDSTYFEGELSGETWDRPVPIGRPLRGTRAYVLDRWLGPAPVGVPGELYVGGEGVARGYLNRPGLTAERFVPDPFGGLSSRLYRTGDVARWRAEGNLELIGRADDQIKVRGFRIEPAEIEAVLLAIPGVTRAAVTARDDQAGGALVAYVVAPGVSAKTLRDGLGERLPGHMVPSYYMFLDAMPLNSSGKVDRRALPAPSVVAAAGCSARPPADEVEARLVALWEELLPVRPVGVTDNFFEIGGHSLLAMRLLNRVEEEFGRALPLTSLLRAATIEDLAALLRAPADAVRWTPLVPMQPHGSGRPFFCVHANGGIVYLYRELARLIGEGQPFYGIQAPGHDAGTEPLDRIEALATCYVGAIREAQPVGPYRIGGWSFGGLIAYEMARQLVAQGQDVEILVLLDTSAPGSTPRIARAGAVVRELAGEVAALELFGPIPGGDPVDDAWVFSEYVARKRLVTRSSMRALIAKLAELDPDARRLGFMEEFGLDRDYYEQTQTDQRYRLLRVIRAHVLAAAYYVPSPYSGRVTLLRCTGGRLRQFRSATLGWKRLAQGGVTVHAVPGDHDHLVKSPGVDAIAAVLREVLAAAGESAR